MEELTFVEFHKIPRLSRECVITEKIDGTNGVIHITENGKFFVGSRTQWITPEKDNFGFAVWCHANKDELMKLGIGTHYGEWWGAGIQRRYGLTEKRFSLFNIKRWGDDAVRPRCCSIIPTILTGEFNFALIDQALGQLKTKGSLASPGFMKPEGIVIYHVAGNLMFKKTIEKDSEWKGKNTAS